MTNWCRVQIIVTCNNFYDCEFAVEYWESIHCRRTSTYSNGFWNLYDASNPRIVSQTQFKITGKESTMHHSHLFSLLCVMFQFQSIKILFAERGTQVYGTYEYFFTNNHFQIVEKPHSFFSMWCNFIKQKIIDDAHLRRNWQNHQKQLMETAVEESDTGNILLTSDENLVKIITNMFFIEIEIPIMQSISINEVRRFVSRMTDADYYQETRNCMQLNGIDETIIELYIASG